jgi:hypothetical protein
VAELGEEALFGRWRLAAISVQVAYSISACEFKNLKNARNSEINPENNRKMAIQNIFYLELDILSLWRYNRSTSIDSSAVNNPGPTVYRLQLVQSSGNAKWRPHDISKA